MIPFESSPLPLAQYLELAGEVYARFLRQDSACTSFGVVADGHRWFVKGATDHRGRESLMRATTLHAAVRHAAIVPIVGSFTAAGEPAVVMPWIDGEVLYHPAEPGTGDLARLRFLTLTLSDRLTAVREIIAAHRAIAGAGFVAADLYDGCFLYDFDRRRMWLVDLDEYRRGPFTVEGDRLPGSTRFMAPEELVPGAVIDERTTVFNLGRTIQVLLADAPRSVVSVARGACEPEPGDRWQSVEDLVTALDSSG